MNKLIGFAGLLFIAAIGAGTYVAYDDSQNNKKSNPLVETQTEEPADTETVAGPTGESADELSSMFLFKEVLTKEKIEKKYPIGMSEGKMQITLHEMTHQKIKAVKKWGLTPITPERIERLLQVVEANKSTYDKEDVYLDMLNNWRIGNFLGIDLQHDTIWAFQDGTVGQANGVFSTTEEKAFIKDNYEELSRGAE